MGNSQFLPALNARNDTVMITGFGSGAYMASQLTHNYPDLIKGAAFVSGGPWFMGTYENETYGGQFKARVGNLDQKDFWRAYDAIDEKCDSS